MNKEQALQLLVDLAYGAELPKGVNGVQASQHLQSIHEAKTILESFIKDKEEDK